MLFMKYYTYGGKMTLVIEIMGEGEPYIRDL